MSFSIETPIFKLGATATATQNATTTQTEENGSIFDNFKAGFTSWLNDEDKVCTEEFVDENNDGLNDNDDGKLSWKEKAESFGKGLLGIVKTAVNHPVMTGLAVAGGVALTVLTGGAAAPVLCAAGAAIGAGTIAYGGYKAATAETDAEAKQAWETMGNGTFALATSALAAGSSLKAAGNGGVTSAQGLATKNPIQNLANCVKVTPAAVQQSGLNIQGNIATWTTGTIHANSNALRNLTRGNAIMSKANEAQAYRFNPAGTPDEVVANNPGVFVGDDGNYYLPNKWNPNEPYLIDTSKEQMIMLYGGDDMAVCDGTVFGKSYVDTAGFKADGALNYQDPADLPYGQVVDVTKQAAGSYAIAPEGTQVQSLEGVATVQKGEVIAVDSLGNPYTQPAIQTLTKNTGFSATQQAELLKMSGIELPTGYLGYDKYTGFDVTIMVNGKETYIPFDTYPTQEEIYAYLTQNAKALINSVK